MVTQIKKSENFSKILAPNSVLKKALTCITNLLQIYKNLILSISPLDTDVKKPRHITTARLQSSNLPYLVRIEKNCLLYSMISLGRIGIAPC